MISHRLLAIALPLVFAGQIHSAEPFRYAEGQSGNGSLHYIQGIPVMIVGGAPEEIGAAVGVLSKPAAEGILGYFDELLKRSKLDFVWPLLVKTSEKMLIRFPPDHRTELEAAIKSSGLPRDKIVVANCLWDIKKLGCSTLFVGPDRSTTGKPMMGRNFDFPTLDVLQKYSLVIVSRPNGKHAYASICFPGLVGVVSGMNDAGLCIATLDVVSASDGSPPFDLAGTPMIPSFRRVLEECTTVEEAEKLLRSIRHTTRLNLAACDAKGTGVVFELTPRTVHLRKASDGLCACTNHFRTEGLADNLSCDRFTALEKSRAIPKLGLREVQDRLHAAHQGATTMKTMIFEPATRTLHIAIGDGPTSAKPLVKLELDSMLNPHKQP